MLGWEVFVLREKDSSTRRTAGLWLASWETGLFGLQWIDELVKQGKAADLGGNGYPNRYTTSANLLFPILMSGLPENESPPVVSDDYALPAGWNSTLKLNSQQIAKCAEDEPLVIEAWDQS